VWHSSGATPLTPVGRSVQRSNRLPRYCPRNRPSSVRQAVVSLVRWRRRQAADDHWRTMNIRRMDGVVGCKLQYYANDGCQTCASLAELLLTCIVYHLKGYGSQRLLTEFRRKTEAREDLRVYWKRFWILETGSTDLTHAWECRSDRSTCVLKRTWPPVDELALSQEDQLQTRRSRLEISREAGLKQFRVLRIIHRDLGLKCLKSRCAKDWLQLLLVFLTLMFQKVL